MTDLPALVAPSPARPYGWIGLPLSLVAILVLAALLCGLVGALVFGIAALVVGWHEALVRVAALVDAMRGDASTSELVALCASILFYLAVALAVVACAGFRGGPAWRDLVAWRAWNPRLRSRLFWLIAGATLLYSIVANEALARFYPASQDWVTLPQGALSIALFFAVATISAPMTEELVFRGWIYTALRAKTGVWVSLILSSTLFALAHWESTHLYALVVFPVGLALGFIRERADSLRASIVFHALYNGVAFVMILFGK